MRYYMPIDTSLDIMYIVDGKVTYDLWKQNTQGYKMDGYYFCHQIRSDIPSEDVYYVDEKWLKLRGFDIDHLKNALNDYKKQFIL